MTSVAKYGCAAVLGVVGAVLAWRGVDGWGWFLFVAALMVLE